MMFLQFFIWGAWYTTIAVYMTHHGMETLTHWPYTVNPIAAIVAPFFLGLVADRYFATEKVLGVIHLLGGVVMFAVPRAAGAPVVFILLLLFYNLCYMPTLGLANSLAFHHIQSQEKQFPLIRVFGTAGWIVAGLFISFVLGPLTGVVPEPTALPTYTPATSSVPLVPVTRRPPVAHHHRDPAPRRVLRLLFRHRSDLRGQEIDTRDSRPGAGIPRAGHLRRRYAHRRAGGGQRVQPVLGRRGQPDPGALAQLLDAAGRVRRGGPALVRSPVSPGRGARAPARGGRLRRVASCHANASRDANSSATWAPAWRSPSCPGTCWVAATARRATSSTSPASALGAWAATTCAAWKGRTSTRCATWIGRAPKTRYRPTPKPSGTKTTARCSTRSRRTSTR